MQNCRKKIILLLKIAAIGLCLVFIVKHYFYEINPFIFSPIFIISFLVLLGIGWRTNYLKKENFFKRSHFLPFILFLILSVHFRAGILWALNTFPLKDAYTVWHTLQEPFDDFAFLMIRHYLIATIPQTFIISFILTIFLYAIFKSAKKRFAFVGIYFTATIIFFINEIPILDYIHILNDDSQKNVFYSEFFSQKYINPDSIKITPPEKKRNLILIYIESMETSFASKQNGGYQNVNLIPEITELAQQNTNFGKNRNNIGGGFDAIGSASTFDAMHTRSLGMPHISNYNKTSTLHNYKSLYKILNTLGYKQVFFQGNPGLYSNFKHFALDQKIDEVYGPDDLIQRLAIDTTELINRHGYKTVQDKDAFKFALQILDTIQAPFSLTFFTIDTHSPSGIYDPECIKSVDENNEDERLKASVRCVSRELKKFIDTLKTKDFYENTSIVIFGDHLFMGTRLVKGFPNRRWINIFINPSKTPTLEEKRLFSDVDMFPTIISSMNFDIDGDKLGFGTDLFSRQKTLIESIGLDSLNKEIKKMSKHLVYENYLLQKKLNSFPK